MSVENDYKVLFDTIHRIVDARPEHVPQLLAVILAGGPFRPVLEKPENLNKVVALAKRYVADKKNEAASGKKPAAAKAAPVGRNDTTRVDPKALEDTPSEATKPAMRRRPAAMSPEDFKKALNQPTKG